MPIEKFQQPIGDLVTTAKSTTQLIEFLKLVEPFGNLSDSLLEKIAGIAALAIYERGEVIYNIGDAAETMYIVMHGEVEHVFGPGIGNHGVKLVREKGFFGWAALFQHQPQRLAKATCLQKTQVMSLNGKQLEGLFKTDPIEYDVLLSYFVNTIVREFSISGDWLWSKPISAGLPDLLTVKDVSVHYGELQAIHEVSLEVKRGEIVALLGANAAGKSTTIRAISGSVPIVTGHIISKGKEIDNMPAHARVQSGIVQIPEGRRLFPSLTVLENLEMGAFNRRARPSKARNIDRVFELFPRLKERKRQLAGLMSGGEQQMCAIGRGLMAEPELLMLDEPTLGLAPSLVFEVLEKIKEINKTGVTILLVEQNVTYTLKMSHRGYVLENGRVVLAGESQALLNDKDLKKAYLGQ